MKTIIIQTNAVTTVQDKEFIDNFLQQVKLNSGEPHPVRAISFIDNLIKEEVSINLEGEQGLLVGHTPIEPIKYSQLNDYNIEII